jgi:hypothetical protein
MFSIGPQRLGTLRNGALSSLCLTAFLFRHSCFVVHSKHATIIMDRGKKHDTKRKRATSKPITSKKAYAMHWQWQCVRIWLIIGD